MAKKALKYNMTLVIRSTSILALWSQYLHFTDFLFAAMILSAVTSFVWIVRNENLKNFAISLISTFTTKFYGMR